jgi:putative phosphoribosyl transferase
VLRAKARGHGDVVTVVGHAATIAASEWITASGKWVNDRTHGQQFKPPFLRTSPLTSADGKPLDLILVRKVGVPFQLELAMGAVVDGGGSIIVRNDDVIEHIGIDEAAFKAVCDAEFAEIERQRERYLGNREHAKVAGRTAIVIDDGIATGATTRAALRATRMRNPKRLVLAVPVAPSDSLPELRREADDIVCLEDDPVFGAIGFYYRDFRQVSDEEVIEILQRFPAGKPRERTLWD